MIPYFNPKSRRGLAEGRDSGANEMAEDGEDIEDKEDNEDDGAEKLNGFGGKGGISAVFNVFPMRVVDRLQARGSMWCENSN